MRASHLAVALASAATATVALAPAPTAAAAQAARLELPTPLSHYEQYDAAAEARAVGLALLARLDPETLAMVAESFGPGRSGAGGTLRPEQIPELLRRIDLQSMRPRLIELLVHQSRVLEVVPEEASAFVPLVHDSLLVMLDRMSDERLRARIGEQMGLPADADRGRRLLAFASRTPTFQKLGQILARNRAIPEDIRVAFQTLENSIETTEAAELVELIETAMGPELIERYRFRFEPQVLSEASVGAVIGAEIVPPAASEPRRVVVKYIKEYAIEAIREDLDSIEALLRILETHGDFYGIAAAPLADMFEELRASMEREIEAAREQQNLRRAAAYFADDERVEIPAVCDCSTPEVTVMERIEGSKVTDAFPDAPERRRRLARRLADVLVYEVLFAAADRALFHGDPHAGNVFWSGDDADPMRIALLDWGLLGELDRAQRAGLFQLSLGLELKHAERLRRNADALVEGGVDPRADRQRLDAAIAAVFESSAATKQLTGTEPDLLELLDDLVSELARAGYTIDNDVLLWVKSMLTTAAVVSDLDPGLDLGDHLRGRLRRQVLRETPRRLANTVWVPRFGSHDYDSLASNADVGAVLLNEIGLGFKAVGVALWKGISFPFRR